ncbi:MAG: sugar ABC transporter ATP-binding protein [Anaerolineaceae bacterium]
MSNEKILLQVKGICKAFGPTRALINVDLEVGRGEIRGLIGENGSGKSTLASIIAGAQPADSGEMFLEGKAFKPQHMVEAQKCGVSMVIQEMGTIPAITVASNIFSGRLGQFTKFGLLDWKQINEKAQNVLDAIGASDIKAEKMIDQYNFEDRKIVEVARAMVDHPNLLIIDETTTALAQKGRTIIYNLIKQMYHENRAVLFISHDLDELMKICNTITVLRDGVIIDTLDKEQMSIDLMRQLMVGRNLEESYYRGDYNGRLTNDVVLRARQVTMYPYFENIDLELHRGEILGFGGLSNSGMHELGRALFGIDKPITGSVELIEKKVHIHDTHKAVKNGMGYVSKDRNKEAIIIEASIKTNVTLPSLSNLSKILGIIPPSSEKKLAQENIKKMRIKCRNEKQLAKELSGGNQQKVVFSKWIAKGCDILILDCPTRGIDIGVKADMYKLIDDFKNSGKAIIMISEELLELIGMSDRMLIFKNGEISKEILRSKDIEEKDIIQYMI